MSILMTVTFFILMFASVPVAYALIIAGSVEVLSENLATLKNFHGPGGRPFEVVEIPLPAACEVPGWRLPVLPASYVNFLIVNGGVLVPTFRQSRNDGHRFGF